jgi:putative SOS response-associated peptidase YedK
LRRIARPGGVLHGQEIDMCGRYTLTKDVGELLEQLEIEFPKELAHPRRYNIAPGQPVLAILADPQPRLEVLEWGFIPTWSKPGAGMRSVINARVESIIEKKPYFRGAFRSARCALLADGFYEWKKVKGEKHPYRIGLRDGGLFAMAGLWSEPHEIDGVVRPSCTIITLPANDFMRPIHDRMPAILDTSEIMMWIDPKTRERDLLAALEPLEASKLRAYEVSIAVNNARYDEAECIKSIEEDDGR